MGTLTRAVALMVILVAGCTSLVPGASAPPSPQVSCLTDGFDCARATQAALGAVAEVGHRAIRITFRNDAMCIWYPFLSGVDSCPNIGLPDGTQRVTNAVVSFIGTDQQAFLNLFWLADGSISTSMALVAPPPGATPFP